MYKIIQSVNIYTKLLVHSECS